MLIGICRHFIISPNFSAVIPFSKGPVDNKATISASLARVWIPSGAHLLAPRLRHSKVDPRVPRALQERVVTRIVPDTCGSELVVQLRVSPPSRCHDFTDLYVEAVGRSL